MTGEELDDAVVIALGSNLAGAWESSEAVIKQALDEFPKIEVRVKAKSTLWRSMAWPDPGGPPYLNAVALVETALPAPALLAALHGLEDRFGRRRERPNAPRTLDLDLIAYGRAVIQGPPLWIPHPRARERGFVMPWMGP
jgi:2-amino-4-hydroxy-6-hydroxymethyldihydropteridine diphosphokinase